MTTNKRGYYHFFIYFYLFFILATTSLASDDGRATPIEVGGERVNRENETTPCWTAMMPSFDLDAGREVAI
jgi:hypothetical protein